MTSDEYLCQLLAQQDLSETQLDSLRSLRERIESQLSVLQGSPRFYYGGSFAKKTMIREAFDLDIVIYWPSNSSYTLKGIFDSVGDQLRRNWQHVNPKTVAWELPFEGGFHIDVVPGRAIDASFRYANLYRRDKDSSLQTSIKVHIDTVRNSERHKVIRLMKLWRFKRKVPFKKSLALELMTIDGCEGVHTAGLEQQLLAVLRYVRDNISSARIVDPANTNNVLSDEISPFDKQAIQSFADAALKSQYWSHVLT